MISLLVPAFNEGQNLRRLLSAVTQEKSFGEIVVVASGCTDDTEDIARSFAPKVRLLHQDRRSGKTSAINFFLAESTASIVVMESADTLPTVYCFKQLLAPFVDPLVGMTGSHITPVRGKGLLGQMGTIMWEAHHRIALQTPKCGELVAFRRVFDQLPPKSSVDEASIEFEITKRGYRLVYVTSAIVYNRAPRTLKDFWKQRRRIARGHRVLAAQGHRVATDDLHRALRATLAATPRTPKGLAALMMLMGIEGTARLLALRDRPEETVWPQAATTKGLD